MKAKVDLSQYNNNWFNPGAGIIKRSLWFMANALFFINPMNPSSGIKTGLLRLFGAKVGKGVVIKPGVNIKYPWNLQIGNFVWLGERVWIDNLTKVYIADNCCLSQGAMLLCGNHNYKRVTFDLMLGEIRLDEGCWIGALSVVCPGVHCETHSVLSVNSVATNNLEAWTIYAGNPAIKIRERIIETQNDEN